MRATLDIGYRPSRAALEGAVEGLVRVNQAYLRETPAAPSLTEAVKRRGLRYRREKRERWKPIAAVLSDGHGDCEDLSAYLAAWLRERKGINARVVIRRSGPSTWHAQVELPGGRIVDPSRALGMGGRATLGAKESSMVHWTLQRTPQGWEGSIALPGGLRAAGTASSKAEAIRKAAGLATRALENPAVQALMPPQVHAALRTVTAVAKNPAVKKALAAGKGAVKSLSSGAKKLISSLW